MKNLLLSLAVIFLFLGSISAQESKKVPSFEEVISLSSVGTPKISPDGKSIVYGVRSVDWKENDFDSEIWISKNGQEPFQLTNSLKSSSSNPKWSPDGKWIAFTSKRAEKTQIFVIRTEGGEAFPLTNIKLGIGNFEWSPDGSEIAFLMKEEEAKSKKKIQERYGKFEVEDQEYQINRLWKIKFDPACLNQVELPRFDKDSTELKNEKIQKSKPEVLIDSVDFTITAFLWSPDGSMIAFSHQPDPLINSFFKSDISVLNLKTRLYSLLVQNLSADRLINWSPDGNSILYSSNLSDTISNYYLNNKIFRIDVNGNNKRQLAKEFDENFSGLTWNKQGIYATAYQKTLRHLYSIDPDKGKVKQISRTPARIYGFSISKNGDFIAFAGEEDNSLREVYITELKKFTPKKLSNLSDQITNWKVANSEVISWKSKDGTSIEGILHKPQNYDPSEKYPLLVIIHGGPTGIDRPSPVPAYVYPIVQWLDKGALILRPNYRGSAGYGEAFRSLNVKNLGIGDAWDILSGINHLETMGMIDTSKIGTMGWSQGGYISAFLTTSSKRFKAISVGAGISDWMTYYVNTDIHPFTRQYLKATPWKDREIYDKTSPIYYINQASTPTLIQHGEFDRRVPIANAFELYQGLQDIGVETKLIVYKGFGHGITKPKERLAATWHNWQWFGKYLWDEEIEIPFE